MTKWRIEKSGPRTWDLYENTLHDDFDWWGSFSTHQAAVDGMVEIEKEESQKAKAAREAFDELRRYEDELGIKY